MNGNGCSHLLRAHYVSSMVRCLTLSATLYSHNALQSQFDYLQWKLRTDQLSYFLEVAPLAQHKVVTWEPGSADLHLHPPLFLLKRTLRAHPVCTPGTAKPFIPNSSKSQKLSVSKATISIWISFKYLLDFREGHFPADLFWKVRLPISKLRH